MVRIFISYRRDDSRDAAGRICDRLRTHFGNDTVFMDVETIPLGIDFRKYVNERLNACDVFLAIIGDHWIVDKNGPSINTRIEVEGALKRGNIPVIPVLVGSKGVPQPEELPEDIREFAYRNGIEIRSDRSFEGQMQGLIAEIKKLTDPGPMPLDARKVGRPQKSSPAISIRKGKTVVTLFLVLIALLLAAGTGYFYVNNKASDLSDKENERKAEIDLIDKQNSEAEWIKREAEAAKAAADEAEQKRQDEVKRVAAHDAERMQQEEAQRLTAIEAERKRQEDAEMNLTKDPALMARSGKSFQMTTLFAANEHLCLESNKPVNVNNTSGGSFMTTCGNFSGQAWKLIDKGRGAYQLQSMFTQKDNLCLEGNLPSETSSMGGVSFMAPCGNFNGQLWTFVPQNDGYFKLKPLSLLDQNKCLEGNKPGPNAPMDGKTFMTPCENNSGQFWKFMQM